MMRIPTITILAVVAAAAPSAAQDVVAAAAGTAQPHAIAASAQDVRVQERVLRQQRQNEQERAQREKEREQERVQREKERAQREKEREQEREKRREDQRFEQTESVSQTVKLGPQGEIDLQNMSGSVTVTRGGGSEATISAVKRARAASEDAAKEMLGLVKIDIVERAGRVEVRTRYPHFDGPRPRAAPRHMNVSVTYTIAAPAGTKLRLHTMSGDLNVSDITGELVLEAMSGNLRIERAARIVTARTMSGDVAIAEVKSDGALDVGSMSGDLSLRQVRARRINAAVVSGSVSLADVDCERLDAQTTSGDVSFEGTLARSGRYRFQSHSGNLKVALAGDTGFELDANSWGGNVRSELTLKNQEQGPPELRRAGVGPRNRTLRGTYGDGSAVLDLTTFSGTIVITRRVGEKH